MPVVVEEARAEAAAVVLERGLAEEARAGHLVARGRAQVRGLEGEVAGLASRARLEVQPAARRQDHPPPVAGRPSPPARCVPVIPLLRVDAAAAAMLSRCIRAGCLRSSLRLLHARHSRLRERAR